MRIALKDLLRDRKIAHPTLIKLVTWTGCDLLVVVTGQRSWSDAVQEDDLTVSFLGISEGRIDPRDLATADDCNEALETFRVALANEVDWLRRADHAIFCNGSVPDPMSLYARVSDALSEAGSIYGPAEFLNGAASLSGFQQLLSSSSFKLGSGPPLVHDVLCAELLRQGVPYNLVDLRPAAPTGLSVWLGDSWFLCREAWAESGTKAHHP